MPQATERATCQASSLPRLAAEPLLAIGVLALLLGPLAAQATMVRLETSLGPMDVVLEDSAPLSKANFLSYVNAPVNNYSSSFIHRKEPGFVIQGGGYKWLPGTTGYTTIPKQAPINLEYSAARPNVRGSLAMARTSALNSATSEWFVNLVDNTTTLGPNNGGGYAVFGRVTKPSMAVVDAIAAMRNLACASPFNTLPTPSPTVTCATVNPSTLVMVKSARELAPPPRAADRIFDYLEAAYPQYTKSSGFVSITDPGLGYYYRHYPESNSYVGEKDGNLYYLVPAIDNNINLLGSVADLLAEAAAAGY